MPKVPVSCIRPLVLSLVSTVVFDLLLATAPMFGAPVLNVALWDGSFLTLNLKIAIISGFILEIVIGGILVYLYHHWISRYFRAPYWQKGLFFGVVLWGAVMVLGLPIFGHINPLVNNGLMLAPGLFARHFGRSTALIFLAALWGFSLPVSYLEHRWAKTSV